MGRSDRHRPLSVRGLLKGYLLDTNVALRAVSTPEVLSPSVKAAIERGPAFLSVVTYWEVMIKSMKGSLDVGDPRQWFAQTLDALGLQPLLFRPEHVAAIFQLPPIHQDPFDRALIGQAIAQELTLLTTDSTIPQYACDVHSRRPTSSARDLRRGPPSIR